MKEKEGIKEKLIDFFDSDELELPRRRGDTNFEDYLEKLFKNHEKLIEVLLEIPKEEKCEENLKIPKEEKCEENLKILKEKKCEEILKILKEKKCEEILKILKEKKCEEIAKEIKKGKDVSKKISKKILECLKEYFNGRVSDAYIKLKEMLDDTDVKEYLERLISTNVDKNSDYAPFSDLYRVTVTDEDLSEKPLRLFHVPYNLREKIGTSRYSIPGFPCLYIGGSAELCWEELNRPHEKKLWLTQYNLMPNTIRLLNFAYRPAIWAACIDAGAHVDRTGLIIGYAVCWPLIAACSIIREYPDSKFAPEYVIPQMLLQWITDHQDDKDDKRKMDGIRYFSTKKIEYPRNIKSTVNYVFPAKKSDGDKMYSAKLAEKFEIKKPILIDKINDSYRFLETEFILKNSSSKSLLDIINKKDLECKINKMSIRMKRLEKMPIRIKRIEKILKELKNKKLK